MESKSFLKHFAVIGSGTLFNLLLGVLTTPLITRIVDPVEYGQLSIFTMYSGIAVMVLCVGLDQALVRYFYEKKTEEYKRKLLLKCIVLPVLLSLIASVAFVLLTQFKIIQFEFDMLCTVLLCIYTVIQIIYRFSLLLVRLAYKSKLYSVLNILHKAVYVVAALGFLILWNEDDLLSLILATILASLVCMIVSILAQRRLWDFAKCNHDEQCVSIRELLAYGYPYIFTMGITTIFQAADKIALNTYCSYTEVGIYASTMTLINIFGIIQTTFNSLWAPMAVEHYSQDKEDKEFYKLGNQAITVVMFFIGISLILFKDVFAVLLGEKYREAAYILPFLIFNPIMYTISETTVMGLVFKKKSKMQVIVALGACVFNIIGNTILVPRFGCQGAAISTGLSYILFFTLRTLLSNKFFYVDYSLKKFYLLTSIVAVYALYNTFIKFNIGSIVGFIISLAFLIGLYNKTIIWGINYIVNLLKEMRNKKLKI